MRTAWRKKEEGAGLGRGGGLRTKERGVPQPEPESAPAPLSEHQEVRAAGSRAPGVPGQIRGGTRDTQAKGPRALKSGRQPRGPRKRGEPTGRGSSTPGPAPPGSPPPPEPGTGRAGCGAGGDFRLGGAGAEEDRGEPAVPSTPAAGAAGLLGRRRAGAGRLRRVASRGAGAPRGPTLAPARSASFAFVTNNSPSVGALAG